MITCSSCAASLRVLSQRTARAIDRLTAKRATLNTAQKCADAENIISVAVAAPTDKRGFVMSDSLAGSGVSTAGQNDCGQDGPTRKDGRMATDMFSHPAHPKLLKTAEGGFFIVPVGA